MSEMKEVKRYTANGKWALILVTETNPELITRHDDIFVRAAAYAALLSEKAALAAENERLKKVAADADWKSEHREGMALNLRGDIREMQISLRRMEVERDRRRDEVRHLRSAIAGAREAIELALRCIDWHTPVDYCPERVRHNNAKAQLRALSSIGDLPAGEEG